MSPYMPPKVNVSSSGLKASPNLLRAPWEMHKLIFFFNKATKSGWIFKRRQDTHTTLPTVPVFSGVTLLNVRCTKSHLKEDERRVQYVRGTNFALLNFQELQ